LIFWVLPSLAYSKPGAKIIINKSMTNTTKPSMAAMNAFYPLTILVGFVQLLVPSTIYMIMKYFNIQSGVAGVLSLIFFTGIMTSAFAITHLIKKFSMKQLMVAGSIIVSVSLLAISQSENFILFALLYLFIGFGNGIMSTLPGIYITQHYSKKSAQLQSMIFSFIALGFVVGSVFPGIISYLNMSWRWNFALPAIMIIPLLIPIMVTKYKPINNTQKLSLRIVKEMVGFDKTFFYGIMVAIILGAGSIAAFLTWLITFLEEQRGTSLEMSHIILATMGISIIIGRLIWGKVAQKIKVYHTLLIIVPVSAVLVFVAPFPQTEIINIILFFVAMIFISGVNPLFLSAAAIYPKTHSSSVYTVFYIFMSLGGMIMPFGVGHVFQYFGAVTGMSSISLLFVFIMGLLLIIKKEIPVSEHIQR